MATSSGSAGPCSTSACGSPSWLLLRRCEIEAKSPRERGEGMQGRVGTLCGEEAAYGLGLHLGAAGKLSLAEVERFTTVIERANDAVDLIDPLPRPLVGDPILRVPEARLQIPLGTRTLLHGIPAYRNLCVTPRQRGLF